VSYKLRHRKRLLAQFTDEDLKEIDNSILAFDEVFQRTIAVHMPSGDSCYQLHMSTSKAS
jgi:hypothetical protein